MIFFSKNGKNKAYLHILNNIFPNCQRIANQLFLSNLRVTSIGGTSNFREL
jgi:hypothetical protein